MRKNFRVLGTVFALALAVTAGCAATGGNAQSSVTSETQAETAVEPGNETAALDGAKDQLEVALKENATLKQELDGTKDQLEVALKQNQETAEKSQTARKK